MGVAKGLVLEKIGTSKENLKTWLSINIASLALPLKLYPCPEFTLKNCLKVYEFPRIFLFFQLPRLYEAWVQEPMFQPYIGIVNLQA